MTKHMKRFTFYFVLLIGLCTATVNAQLSNFNLEVNKTDETCKGNGSLTFAVSNTTANAIITYKVYKMPNVSNALTIQTDNYFGGLESGTYKVIAVQSFGSLSNNQEKQVIINNATTPFSFSISSLNHNCSSGGGIVLNATSGTIAQCEILSGPQTRLLQASSTFDYLPAGTYNVRAFNECGVGKVKTFTLSIINSTLNISDPAYSDVAVACDSIMVSNKITPSSGPINYPLSVRHTLSPMSLSGQDIIIDQYFATGDPEMQVVSARVPRHLTDPYTYSVSVTDNCNNVYLKDDNVVDPGITLSLMAANAPCAEKYLVVTAGKYTGSYTVKFINAPADFDPQLFNATPQGPFTDASATYGGIDNPVPFGTYEVEITDSCGRIAKETILIEFIKPKPSVGPYNNGCFSLFGGINISVPPQRIVSATITKAPGNYSQATPKNIVANINTAGNIKLINLPLGEYTIEFKDDCGFEYKSVVIVPEYKDKGLNIASLPSCDEHFGTVRVRSGNGDLNLVKIIDAPASFGQALPFDVTASVNAEGDLYMANLPEGAYKFSGGDVCGVSDTLSVNIEGYIPPVDSFKFTPKCGSFTLEIKDNSNGVEGATYWLQKYFPATNSWGHPQSGGTYVAGAVPTASNALRLYNNATRNNINYSGDFRIIKKFETFTEGSSTNSMCVSELGKFHYTEQLSITAAYTLACADAPNDVVVEYEGYPTSFKIIKKNGQNFVINNGSSNIFRNLEPAEYVFQMQDACFNVVTQWFNVVELPSIREAQKPTDLIQCAEPGEVSTVVFHLTDKDVEILGPLYSSMYGITYYASEIEAEAGENPLPEYYTNLFNGQEIFARLENVFVPACHALTSFKLVVGEIQEPVIRTFGTICNQGKLSLTAAPGYDDYIWSTGETTRTIYVTEPGNYKVEVRKNYGNVYCPGFAEVDVKQSFTPQITKIVTEDWTLDENMITVLTDDESGYEYSIDGINYQEDKVFTGMKPGVYTVHVKDIDGCGEITQEVVLLNYPNYFTPNGDGEHDRWHIKHSFKEPNFTVAIFDRYGKLLTTLQSNSEGWDGTLNGIQLPSTDYWFVVNRQDGRELRGHFAMMR